MLEQLDLFSAVAQEKPTDYQQLLKERKLTPPAIIEITEPEETPVAKKQLTPVNEQNGDPDVENNNGSAVPEFTIVADTEPTKKTRGRKSQKEMSMEAGKIEVPEDNVLFSKQYYGIGEVAVMFSVNASLLRYWESEFDILKPRKNKKGDRFFRPDDIKNLQLIHHLLRERKYTIDGAREFLKKGKKANELFEAISRLKTIRAFLVELKAGI